MTAAAKILDPCCGSRMFWFDKGDQRALFGDIRDEQHVLCDGRVLNVEPNVIMDFRTLPFTDGASGSNTGPVITYTSPLARSTYLRVSCSILAHEPPFCCAFWGTMFAKEKLCAMAVGVGMSPAGAM